MIKLIAVPFYSNPWR